MRFFVKKYANNRTFAIETSNDGDSVEKEVEGKREVGERISAYAEVMCDDNEIGVDRALEAVSLLQRELEERKKQLC